MYEEDANGRVHLRDFDFRIRLEYWSEKLDEQVDWEIVKQGLVNLLEFKLTALQNAPQRLVTLSEIERMEVIDVE